LEPSTGLRASAKQEKVGGQLDEALVCARDTEKAMHNALKFSRIQSEAGCCSAII
jgi:hypothetical protein